jgi:diguanylate cyclase (GGDEF)-like protein
MHPDAASDLDRDAIRTGRDTLRLVKIRLALTLLTVAILPMAAVVPVIRAITDDSRVGQQARLAADADHAAADIVAELRAIRTGLAALANDKTVLAALGAKVNDAALAQAGARLGSLVARPAAAVTTVVLADPKGTVRVTAGATAPVATGIPPGDTIAYRVLPADAGGVTALEVSIGAAPGGAKTRPGVIVARVSIPALLASSAPDATVTGRTISIVDEKGEPLARAGAFDASAIPGAVLDMTTDSGALDGSAAISVGGLPAWRVVATAPLAFTALPLPVLAALVLLIVLLVLFVFWMARQILRPAAELEASRARLHGMYETAREAALQDSLTGLGNHRAFQEAVGGMVDASRRYGMPFALILFDIDEFKRVNDTRGHAIGDQLLTEVGEIIRATIRQADAGFRIGGDEFAILLPHTDAGGADALARRLLSRGLDARAAGGYGGPISFSAGVTACPEFGSTRLELTAQADAALYRGKRAGRTVVTVFDPALDRGHVDEGMRAELSSAISGVIESASLSPVFQPIVHLPTGRILGYEGLVRVDGESVFPHTGALFDAAEVAGRVLDLDRAALDVVLKGATAIAPPTLVSLNVSPRSFEVAEFNATAFLSILRRFHLPPERVLLELTEREAVRDPERLRSAVLALQAAGVRVAADDVGAGNAGLRLLSQFRFDVVKIDLSLVQGGAGQEQTLSVLTTLVQLASRWGALTIAEGVETPAQLRMIRALGIEAAQGYLLGRPGPHVDLGTIDLDELAADEPDPPVPAGTPFWLRGGAGHVPTSGFGVVPIARPTLVPPIQRPQVELSAPH